MALFPRGKRHAARGAIASCWLNACGRTTGWTAEAVGVVLAFAALMGAALADPGFPLFNEVLGSKYTVSYDNRSFQCV